MVNILHGYHKGFDILFVDEVTSSIDSDRHRKVMERLVTQCSTIICIRHNQELLSFVYSNSYNRKW